MPEFERLAQAIADASSSARCLRRMPLPSSPSRSMRNTAVRARFLRPSQKTPDRKEVLLAQTLAELDAEFWR